MKEFNFEEAMERLQEISDKLEDTALPLDQAIALFEEGLELSKQCQSTLDSYEEKVKSLVAKYQDEAED